MDVELLRTLGVPALILSVSGAIGAYWRQSLKARDARNEADLKERAARIEADRELLRAERKALDNERALRDAMTKELIDQARAREKSLEQRLDAEREQHIAAHRNLDVLLDALRGENTQRHEATQLLVITKAQELDALIRDRRNSNAIRAAEVSAVRAAEEAVARLSGDYTPSPDDSIDVPPAPEQPLRGRTPPVRIPRQDPPPRPARDADASARRRPLPPLSAEEAERVLDPRRRT